MSLEYKIFSSDYQAQDVTKVNTGDSVQEAGEDGKGEGIENVIPVEAKEVRGMLQRLQWTGGISSMKNLYFQKIFYGTFWYFMVLFGTFWYFSEHRLLPFASVAGCLIYGTLALLFFSELL